MAMLDLCQHARLRSYLGEHEPRHVYESGKSGASPIATQPLRRLAGPVMRANETLETSFTLVHSPAYVIFESET